MTSTNKEAQVTWVTEIIQVEKEVILDQVSCIYNPVQFQGDKRATIQALINLGSKVNAMTLAYAKQLGLRV